MLITCICLLTYMLPVSMLSKQLWWSIISMWGLWGCSWRDEHLNHHSEEDTLINVHVGQSQLFVTPWTAAHQASPSFTISQSLLKLTSIESMMLSNHLILCCPFTSCPQSSPGSGSFPVSQLFRSGAQSTGASASASVLPMNIQDLLPLELTGIDLLAV